MRRGLVFDDEPVLRYLLLLVAALAFAWVWRWWFGRGTLERVVTAAAGAACRAVAMP